MSTGKLLINKIEDGISFKSLQITIREEDNMATDINFSEWTEGEAQMKNKDSEKSSRLVVKVVSGEEYKNINLDSCAKEIEHTAPVHTDINARIISSEGELQTLASNHLGEYQAGMANTLAVEDITELQNYNSDTLEHSLQKVKENNARIMENINLLNRTLNYTKKKEILDIICPRSIPTYPCNACGKCFVYETGLRRHYAIRHAINETQPRWQVVWTCIQCFQVWPRQDQAAQHSTECCKSAPNNQECVREIKTSLLLQCEFCEKVFTSIPRLLRHSKVHTTVSNYECNSCGLTFASYKIAEQHWPLCPWLNTYYCFSLPKMLLCNACDRKFRSYEQLYNHRYKVGHFMTKTHSSIGSVKSLGMLVYQCELCGQWYNSIPQMITHRSQHHLLNDAGPSNKTDNTSSNESVDSYYMPVGNEYDIN